MKLGGKHYRQMMADLDGKGIHTQIFRSGRGLYQLLVNYEIVKQAATRKTCNKHLVKLHKKHTGTTAPLCKAIKTIKIVKYKKGRKCK